MVCYLCVSKGRLYAATLAAPTDGTITRVSHRPPQNPLCIRLCRKSSDCMQGVLWKRGAHLHGLQDGAAAPGVLNLRHRHSGVQQPPQRGISAHRGRQQRADEVAGGVQVLACGLLRAAHAAQSHIMQRIDHAHTSEESHVCSREEIRLLSYGLLYPEDDARCTCYAPHSSRDSTPECEREHGVAVDISALNTILKHCIVSTAITPRQGNVIPALTYQLHGCSNWEALSRKSKGENKRSPAAGQAVWRPARLGRQHGTRYSSVSNHVTCEVARQLLRLVRR